MKHLDFNAEQQDFIDALAMKYFDHKHAPLDVKFVPVFSEWQKTLVDSYEDIYLAEGLSIANQEFSDLFYKFFTYYSTDFNVLCDDRGKQQSDKTFRALVEFDLFLQRIGSKTYKDLLVEKIGKWVSENVDARDPRSKRETVLEILRIPKFGEQYKHSNGNIYVVNNVSNVDATNSKYIKEIFYVGSNGKQWSKNIIVFKQTMEKV